MHSVLNTLSEYTYFYMLENITSYALVACFLNDNSLQCILKGMKSIASMSKSKKRENRIK